MNGSGLYPPGHPAPVLRLARAMGGTLWALGCLRGAQPPRACLQRWATRTLAALGVEVLLDGELPAGGQLWLSNHLSWLDPLVFLSLRPSQVLAKSEVAGYPGIGPGALKAGLRFVNRQNLFNRAGALRRMTADLQNGEDMLLFPEGTTTRGSALAPLQEGGLRMAYRVGAITLPFRLACADAHYPWVGDETLLPHLKTMAQSRRTRVTVRPGTLLDPRDCPGEEQWVRLIRDQLQPPFEVAHAV